MSVLHRKNFLAQIVVCSRNRICHTAIIESTLDKATAERLALEKMTELGGQRSFTSLHHLAAVYHRDAARVSFAGDSNITPGVRVHEEFHHRVSSFGLDTDGRTRPLEESGAYAVESKLMYRSFHKEQEAIAEIKRLRRLGRNSVRFMYALHNKMTRLLSSSMRTIKANSYAVEGHRRSIALHAAANYLLYLECLAVLRCRGACDGEKIILDTISIARDFSLDNARKFLLSRIPRSERTHLDETYGVDVRSFRFFSPYSVGASSETLFFDSESPLLVAARANRALFVNTIDNQ